MYNQQLLDIYRLHVARGGARHGDIERHLCLNEPVAPVSVDDQRNEPSTFEELFSGDGIRYLEALYQRLMWQMQGVPFAETSETLGALSFLQVVLASRKDHCAAQGLHALNHVQYKLALRQTHPYNRHDAMC